MVTPIRKKATDNQSSIIKLKPDFQYFSSLSSIYILEIWFAIDSYERCAILKESENISEKLLTMPMCVFFINMENYIQEKPLRNFPLDLQCVNEIYCNAMTLLF